MSFGQDWGFGSIESRIKSRNMEQLSHCPRDEHTHRLITGSAGEYQESPGVGHNDKIGGPHEVDELNFFLGLHSTEMCKAPECDQEKDQSAPSCKEECAKSTSHQDGRRIPSHSVLEVALSPSITLLLKMISREHDDILMSNPDLSEEVRTSGLLQVDCLQSVLVHHAKNKGKSTGAMLHVVQTCSLLAVLKQAADLILKFGPRVTYLYVKHVS